MQLSVVYTLELELVGLLPYESLTVTTAPLTTELLRSVMKEESKIEVFLPSGQFEPQNSLSFFSSFLRLN